MPPAARITDFHTCPMITGSYAHVGGAVNLGDATVLIGNRPAARVTDTAICNGPPDRIAVGASTVLIGHLPAARMGDTTTHGGVIAQGCPTVLIGSSPQADALQTDLPFCDQCSGS